MPPPVLRLEVPDNLLRCAAAPPNPCPANDDETPPPKNPPRSMMAAIWGKDDVIEARALDAPLCREKDRQRWEARLHHAQADCESKLRALGKLLNGRARDPPAQ